MNINVRVELSRNLMIILIGLIFTIAAVLMNQYQLLLNLQRNNNKHKYSLSGVESCDD